MIVMSIIYQKDPLPISSWRWRCRCGNLRHTVGGRLKRVEFKGAPHERGHLLADQKNIGHGRIEIEQTGRVASRWRARRWHGRGRGGRGWRAAGEIQVDVLVGPQGLEDLELLEALKGGRLVVARQKVVEVLEDDEDVVLGQEGAERVDAVGLEQVLEQNLRVALVYVVEEVEVDFFVVEASEYAL